VRYATGLVWFALLVVACHPAAAEEISLKDGTKIVGHMTGVTPDGVEVQTSYGKIQLKRSDILTISFPENGTARAAASEPAGSKAGATKLDEALVGVQYTNRTGQFALTLPADWMIASDLNRAPETLSALSSKDRMGYVIVMREEYPGSLDSYKELTLLSARKSLGNFEELAQSSRTIDGQTALLVYYRGTLQKGSNLPVEFVSAILVSGKTFTKVTAWSVEPLFRDLQPVFEKILTSYHTTAGQALATASPL
jgi:hypothetical protein